MDTPREAPQQERRFTHAKTSKPVAASVESLPSCSSNDMVVEVCSTVACVRSIVVVVVDTEWWEVT